MSVIRALGEIALRVNDLEVMQRFYEQMVGLELIKRFPHAAFFKITEGYGGHTQVLALFDRSGEMYGPRVHRTTPDGVDSGRSTLDHLAFEIDLADYESEKSRLEEHGLTIEVAQHEWMHWRSLYISDPVGNTVEFVCFDENVR